VLEGLGEVIADPTCSKDTPFQGWCCEEEGVMVLGCVLFVLVGVVNGGVSVNMLVGV
jgi:hypothetical protein